jgi:predicted dehydrogenase
VTEVKSGPGFQKAAGSELVAVMRRQGVLAEDYAKRHGVPRWYDDGDRLIQDPGVDAVYIATPPGSHEVWALKAAAAGKPAYVEKPMARSHAECLRMVAAFQQADCPLYVAYYRRAMPRFVAIRDILNSGGIGEIRSVQVLLHQKPEAGDFDPGNLPWRVRPELSGGGRFLDLASHTLDILDFLLGPVAEVDGRAANLGGLYPAEDVVAGSWRHESGATGSGVWCFCAGYNLDRCELIGSAGSLRFSIFGNEPLVLEREGERGEIATVQPEHVQQPLIQTMVDELLGRGTCPSTGESGARTSRVMDRMLETFRASRGIRFD